jgi:hypothetical protein
MPRTATARVPRPKARKVRPTVRPTVRPLMSHVRDKRGRLDVLAVRLAERLVERKGSPLIKELFKEFTPDITHLASQYLGPRNPRAKRVRNVIIRLGEQGAFKELESRL